MTLLNAETSSAVASNRLKLVGSKNRSVKAKGASSVFDVVIDGSINIQISARASLLKLERFSELTPHRVFE